LTGLKGANFGLDFDFDFDFDFVGFLIDGFLSLDSILEIDLLRTFVALMDLFLGRHDLWGY